MRFKRKYAYTIIAILATLNYGLLAYNNRTTGQISPNNGLLRVSEQTLGNSAFNPPSFFKISSSSIQNINDRDFFIGDGTSSASANASVSFAVDSRAPQGIRFGGFATCNLDTDSNGYLVCGTDASGGGGGGTQIELKDVPGTYNTNVSSISFDGGKFTITASGTQTNTWTALNTFSASPLSIQGTSASLSVNFEVVGYASESFFRGSAFSGIAGAECSDDGDTLAWNNGTFTCGDDDNSGGGVGGNVADGLDIANSGGSFFAIASLSFDATHFTFSNTASEGYVRLDWGAGGPASLSEAETITGNWVNTASPWADNEVIDALTINGGTVTWTDLTTYPTGCTNQFVTTVGDTLTCATADDAYVNDAITISGGTIGSNTISSQSIELDATVPLASAAQSQSLAPVRLSIWLLEQVEPSGIISPLNEKFPDT